MARRCAAGLVHRRGEGRNSLRRGLAASLAPVQHAGLPNRRSSAASAPGIAIAAAALLARFPPRAEIRRPVPIVPLRVYPRRSCDRARRRWRAPRAIAAAPRPHRPGCSPASRRSAFRGKRCSDIWHLGLRYLAKTLALLEGAGWVEGSNTQHRRPRQAHAALSRCRIRPMLASVACHRAEDASCRLHPPLRCPDAMAGRP